MIKRTLFLFSLLVATLIPVIAGDSAAKVTEAVNQVDRGSSQATATTPAKPGTVLHDGDYLKTGIKSRAELELANQTVTRLGANTIFNYSAADNEINLQAGTILFSKPKDASQMTIKTSAVTAAVVGTTGFLQVHGKSFMFGLIEGHATLSINGVDYTIHAGEILKFTPGGIPQIFSFNVPLLVNTSPLLTKFKHHLPNQEYIDHEIAEYDDLVARGFIQPPKDPFFLTDLTGSVPTVPIPAEDSAQNAHDGFNNPPAPPQQQPVPPNCPPYCGYSNYCGYPMGG